MRSHKIRDLLLRSFLHPQLTLSGLPEYQPSFCTRSLSCSLRIPRTLASIRSLYFYVAVSCSVIPGRAESSMETTLSKFPAGDMDLMSPFYSSLNDINQADGKDNMALFPFDDIESAALYQAFRNQEQELVTGLRHGSNLAEEPTTVAPLATLLSFDSSSSDTNTLSPMTTVTTLWNKDSAAILTPPTPISNSPSPQPAVIAPPAPTSVDVNKQNQYQEPRSTITPAMIDMLAQHLHEELIELNHSSSNEPSNPAPTNMDYPPVEDPHQVPMHQPMQHPHPAQMHHPMRHPQQVPMCHLMHYPGHRPVQCPTGYGHYCPHHMFCPHVGRPLLQIYPVPSPAPRQPPVSDKRTFKFVEPDVPDNFVANPNNHGRWQYDRSGNRHYLNAPKTKMPHAK